MSGIISYVLEMCQHDYNYLREIIAELENIADEWENEDEENGEVI